MIIQSLNNEKFNKKHRLSIFIIIVFQACKSIAILPTNSPIKNVNIEALASKIRSNYPKVNNVRSRIKLLITMERENNRSLFNLEWRVKRNFG